MSIVEDPLFEENIVTTLKNTNPIVIERFVMDKIDVGTQQPYTPCTPCSGSGSSDHLSFPSGTFASSGAAVGDDCSTLPSEGPDSDGALPTEEESYNVHFDLQVLSSAKSMVQTIMNEPSRVEYGKLKFLILDAPSNENLVVYIKEMVTYGITNLVRTCESTYDDRIVEGASIGVHELIFPDGEAPSTAVIDKWLELVKAAENSGGSIAVHCVAGLGRAPVLVVIALIEYGMDPIKAIMYVRERRRGAINRRQLQFLKNYRRRKSQKLCCNKGCVIV